MKGKRELHNEIYISYLISYLAMGLILLILSLMGYYTCQQTILEKIQFSQNTILSSIQSDFDKHLENVEKSGQVLSGNNRINALSELETFSPENHLELQSVRDEIFLQTENAGVCDGIAVYFPKSDLLVTQEQVYPGELRKLFYDKSQYRQEDIQLALQLGGLRGYLIGETTQGETRLYIVENVYNFNFKEKRAVIILAISWSKLQQMVKLYGPGNVYWMNSENIRLDVTEASEWDIPVSYNDFSAEEVLIYTGSGANQIISSYRQSEHYDWKYCVSMRRQDYFAELHRMRLLICAQVALFLVIAVLLAVFISRRKYRPLEKILSAVRNNQRTDRKIKNLEEVEQYLERIFQENSRLMVTWNMAQENMMGEIVSGYIKGWNGDAQMVEETFAQKRIHLEKGYLALLITFRDISECKLFAGSQQKIRHRDWKLLEFAFRNIFNEMILTTYQGLMLRMDNDYLCVLSIGEDQVEKLCEETKKCVDVFREYLNLNLFVGISGFHVRVEELSKAYNESVQVLAYQTFWGSGSEGIGLYDVERSGLDCWAEDNLMLEGYRHLFNLMSAKQYDQAAQLLDEMMDKLFIRDIRYTELNRSRMSGLLDIFSLSLRRLFERQDEDFLRELDPIGRLSQQKSVESARRTMQEIFRQIVCYLSEKADVEKPRWLQNTIREIEENYANVNLSLTWLSEQQNMNLAYIGRSFKQHMGCSVPDYIHMVRIREAKRLLAEGVSVKCVAEQVGYVDSKALIRIFKKQERITPGQFKAELEKE